MEHCHKCHRETRWEADIYGEMHCLGCKERERVSGARWEGWMTFGLVMAILIVIVAMLKLMA